MTRSGAAPMAMVTPGPPPRTAATCAVTLTSA